MKIRISQTKKGETVDEDPHCTRMEIRMVSKGFTEGKNSVGDCFVL